MKIPGLDGITEKMQEFDEAMPLLRSIESLLNGIDKSLNRLADAMEETK